MKGAAILAFAALAASAVSAIDIPAEHHQRFLHEQAAIADELARWKDSAAGQAAKKHGFYKESSSDNSIHIQIGAITVDSDHLKRFFLTKLSIAEAEKANPEATFSVNTPFTLMTDAEFAQFVKRSSGTIGGSAAPSAANVTLAVEEPVNSNTAHRNLATSLDWTTSGCVSSVKDQGNCGSCWAFASTASLESANCLKTGALQLFSEQQVTSCDPQSGGCDGGVAIYALDYLKGFGGICTADSYPYKSGDSGVTGACSTNGCNKKAIAISSVEIVDESEAALIAAIIKQPVAVSLAAGNNEWKQYTGGVVSSCSTNDLDHAVLAVGYDDTSFKLKNQWSTWWGENGYIRLKRNGANSACHIVNGQNTYPKLA